MIPELTPKMPKMLPCRAVVCDPRPEIEPARKKIVTKVLIYTACKFTLLLTDAQYTANKVPSLYETSHTSGRRSNVPTTEQ